MILGGLFKTPKNRKFTYEPRFYDEQKERRDRLTQSIEEAEKLQAEGKYVPNIRGRIQRRRSGHSSSSSTRSKTMLIILLIKLGLVVGIIYLVFKFIDRIYG